MEPRQEMIQALRDALDLHMRSLIDQQKMLEESRDQEGKSSAGDKYETTRERISAELDRVDNKIQETQRSLLLVEQIAKRASSERVSLGSLVQTTKGRFLLGVASSAVHTSHGKVYCISPSAPYAECIIGLRLGEKFVFREQMDEILALD